MSTSFPEGIQTPVYTWGSMCTVTFFMMITQIDFNRIGETMRGLYTKVEITQDSKGPFKWPAIFAAGLLAVSWAIVGIWWGTLGYTSTWGFKATWVLASFVISTPPLLVVLPYHIFGEKALSAPVALKKIAPSYLLARVEKMNYSYFVYAINYMCLFTFLIMTFLSLWLWGPTGSGGGQIASTARIFLLATGVEILAILLGDLVFKGMYMRNNDRTAGLIDTMVANKRARALDLSKADLKPQQLANFASLPPLTFARTQGIGFARDDAAHVLAHQVETQMIRPDAKTTLGIKDYNIIQTNENKAIVVSSKDADALMNCVPAAELNFERHGLLAPVNHFSDKRQTAVDRTVENDILKLTEAEKNDTDKFFFRIFDNEPPVLFYENYVFGFSKGNGVYVNTPGFLPIFLTVYLLAFEMQLWRSTGIGLMVSMITLAPCFVAAYVGHERSYLHLFWLNSLTGIFIIVVQRGLGYTTNFIMSSAVIGDITTPWLYSSATNADQVVSVQFTTYFAFFIVNIWIIGSAVKLFVQARNK